MFVFTKDCCIGVTEIDNEHRKLFELIQEVDVMLKSEDSALETALSLINEVKQYAVYHFAHEEAYTNRKQATWLFSRPLTP